MTGSLFDFPLTRTTQETTHTYERTPHKRLSLLLMHSGHSSATVGEDIVNKINKIKVNSKSAEVLRTLIGSWNNTCLKTDLRA